MVVRTVSVVSLSLIEKNFKMIIIVIRWDSSNHDTLTSWCRRRIRKEAHPPHSIESMSSVYLETRDCRKHIYFLVLFEWTPSSATNARVVAKPCFKKGNISKKPSRYFKNACPVFLKFCRTKPSGLHRSIIVYLQRGDRH